MELVEAKAAVFDLLRQKEIIEVRLQQAIRVVAELEKKENEVKEDGAKEKS
jgi:hypothetical protein